MSNETATELPEVVLPPTGDPVSSDEFKEWFESLGAGPVGNAREISFHPLGMQPGSDWGVMMRVERYAINAEGHRFFPLTGSPLAPRKHEAAREVVWVPLRRLPA